MTVLAYLPPRLLQHLRFILGPDSAPLVAKSWEDVDRLIQSNAVSVAIVDPSEEPSGKAIELEQLMAAYPSLPVIAYVQLTPLAFKTITLLAQTGMRHVVLYSTDDDAPRFLSLIDQAETSPLTGRLVSVLRPKLVMLPIRLAKTVENLFAEPHRYPNAQDIATASAIPLVKVHRAFREAGLTTPKRIFIAAKMLKAFSYLGDPAHSVHSVSKKLGYKHARILSDHSNEVFGLNPSRLHAYMTEESAVVTMLRFVSRQVIAEPEALVSSKKQIPSA